MNIPAVATLTAAGISAIIDAYTGEIPEWITVPTILLGLIYAWFFGFFWTALAVVVITLALGYALYYTGQLGGGDVLLLAGIGAWIPTALPQSFGWIAIAFNVPLIILFLGLLFSSVFFSVFYSLQLGEENKTFLWIPLGYAILPPALAVTYGAVITSILGTKYREVLFVREKPIDDVLPEDVLAEEIPELPPGKKVLEKKDIALLKERGVKTVKILDNLPRFGPFIFLALALLLWFVSNPSNLDSYAATLFTLKIH
jgi:Flp pilus assembly protein protease CpaA